MAGQSQETPVPSASGSSDSSLESVEQEEEGGEEEEEFPKLTAQEEFDAQFVEHHISNGV